MARKRVNIAFIAISVACVLGIVLLGVAWKLKWHRWILYGSPDKYIAQARQLMNEKRWEEAGKVLQRAGTLKGPDPDLNIMFGDVHDAMSGDSQENFQKAVGYWTNALSIDPRYLPALERLLHRARDVANVAPYSICFQNLRDAAQKYIAVDPDSKEAQYLLHMSTIQLWRTGGQIDPLAVDEATQGLEGMLKADPAFADAMFQLASVKLHRAQESYRANDDVTMRKLMDEAGQLAAASLQGQENNADMHYRAGLVYQGLGQIERSLKGDYAKWEELARVEAEKARSLVKVGDEKYLEIQDFEGRLLLAKNQIEEAEKVYRALAEQYPRDQKVRLSLARVLGNSPERREEALAILSQPIAKPSEMTGVKAMAARDDEAQTISAVIDLRLNATDGMSMPDRQKLLAELDPQYERLLSLRGERPEVIMLRGRMQMTRGDAIGAVQSFNTVLRSAEPISPFDRIRTLSYLTDQYIATNQPGQAKQRLMELIRYMDAFPGGEATTANQRMLLIDLLLGENSPLEAKPHVEVLERILKPDDPRLHIARMAALDRVKQKAEILKNWDQLPETDRNQVINKARIAMRILDDDELAAKLLDKYRKANPNDVEMVLGMAQLYSSMERKADAQKIVDEALVKAPEDQRLIRAKKALAGEVTQEDIRAERVKQIETQQDPVVKQLLRYDMATAENKPEEAIAALLEADKLKPDQPRILDLLFRSYASQQNWEKAGEYLDKLTKVSPEQGQFARPRYLMVRGQAKEALELAQQLTRDRGDFAQAWLTLAQVQHAVGKLLDAIASYKTALERDNRNFDAMQGLIECYYRINNPQEAKRYIDAAQRIYPENPTVREQGLMYEVQFGNPEVAIGPRQEQLKKDDTNAFNWLALGQAYFAAARGKIAAGKTDEANGYFQKAKATFDQGYAKFPADQRFATSVAEVALKLQKPDEGEKAIRALIARKEWEGRIEPSVMLADYLLLTNRTDEAEKVFRDILSKTPDVNVQMRLAELLNRTKGVEEAVKVLDANSDKAPARRLRIDLLVRAGKIQEAQRDLDQLSAGQPPSATNLELQACIYMNSNRPNEALETLNKAIQLDPNYSLALYRRGYLRLYARGDTDGAIADLTRVRDLAPGLSDPRVTLANAYRYKGDIDGAIRELEDAMQVAPSDRNVRVQLLDFYGQAVPPRWRDFERVLSETRDLPQYVKDPQFMLAEANMWATRKEWQNAMKAIKEAANIAPNDLTILKTFFDILNKAKGHKELMQLSDRLLKTQPNLWWVYQARGIAKCNLNDKDGALLEFEQGLKVAAEQGDEKAAQQIVSSMAQEVGYAAALKRVEPKAQTDPRWQMLAAQLCRSQGDFAGGIKWIEMLMADPQLQGPQREMVMGMAGEFYFSKTPPDFAKAAEIFKKMVDENPENPGALNNLAAVMTMPNAPWKPEEALVYSDRAFGIMTRTGNIIPEVLDTHGWILVQVGRVDEGIQMLMNAVDRRPIPDAYYHLAEAYLKQGKPEDADKMLKLAQDAIARAERDRQAVDPTLKARVEEAMSRVGLMAQQKASQASDGTK
jgi:tetratricopeptide (TPR) repeat protein